MNYLLTYATVSESWDGCWRHLFGDYSTLWHS